MSLFIRLAWRNVFRNSRRTWLAALAISLGLSSLMFSDALMEGMKRGMIETATETFLGEGQIHREEFQNTMEVDRTVQNRSAVIAALRKNPHIAKYTARVKSFAMVTSAAEIHSVMLTGIDPDREPAMSRIDEALQRGDYLAPGDDRKILIGSDAAQQLDVDVGDKVVLTAAKAGSGDLAQEMFRIKGVFSFNVREMDSGMVFVSLKKAQQMLSLKKEVHEIAFSFDKIQKSRDPESRYWTGLTSPGNETQNWEQLMPELSAMLDMSQFGITLIGVILAAIVAVGIVNTLFMSLYERMFEFGVLRAVGTRPFYMALLVVFEAGALALLSIFLGVIIGVLITGLFAEIGIDYRGAEFVSVTINELLFPVFAVRQYTLYPLLLFVFTMTVGIYPAVYAARITPSRAMKKRL